MQVTPDLLYFKFSDQRAVENDTYQQRNSIGCGLGTDQTELTHNGVQNDQ